MDPASAPKLDFIRVRTECSVPWDSMAGDDKVRHCALCKLNVYHLSNMTREEAEGVIGQREGRFCVRLFRRTDGTILTRDCSPIRARRARRLAGMALSFALLVLTGGTWGFLRRQAARKHHSASQGLSVMSPLASPERHPWASLGASRTAWTSPPPRPAATPSYLYEEYDPTNGTSSGGDVYRMKQ